jgi:hypothetical protein
MQLPCIKVAYIADAISLQVALDESLVVITAPQGLFYARTSRCADTLTINFQTLYKKPSMRNGFCGIAHLRSWLAPDSELLEWHSKRSYYLIRKKYSVWNLITGESYFMVGSRALENPTPRHPRYTAISVSMIERIMLADGFTRGAYTALLRALDALNELDSYNGCIQNLEPSLHATLQKIMQT